MLTDFKRFSEVEVTGPLDALIQSFGREVRHILRDLKRHPRFYAISFVLMLLGLTLTSHLMTTTNETSDVQVAGENQAEGTENPVDQYNRLHGQSRR